MIFFSNMCLQCYCFWIKRFLIYSSWYIIGSSLHIYTVLNAHFFDLISLMFSHVKIKMHLTPSFSKLTQKLALNDNLTKFHEKILVKFVISQKFAQRFWFFHEFFIVRNFLTVISSLYVIKHHISFHAWDILTRLNEWFYSQPVISRWTYHWLITLKSSARENHLESLMFIVWK